MIYRYSCNYNDAIVLFERQVDDVRNGRASFDSNAKSILTTPTILLLNQQITREAMEVLHKTPLVLDMKSPAVDWTNCRPKISIFKFIGLWTLINISLVQIRHPILIGHGCSYLKDLFLECPPMPQRERSAPRHLQFIIEDDGDDEDWTGGTGMAMRDISNRIIEEVSELPSLTSFLLTYTRLAN